MSHPSVPAQPRLLAEPAAEPRRAPWLRTAIALGLVGLLGACATTPRPLADADMARLTAQDRQAATAGQVPLAGPLTLEAAIARALKHNLDHRTRLLEQALASGQLEAGRFDMLPRLVAAAGYSNRDTDATRRSADPANPGQFSTTTPYISSERQHETADLGLTWNLLDFGASYYASKQNADRLLVAGERRRRAMHQLVQNVRTAYWRALAAQAMGDRLRTTVQEAEAALGDAAALAQQRVRAPADALRYQRNLLENLRVLEGLERELAAARIELAGLIGVPAATAFTLVEPAGGSAPQPITLPIDQIETMALQRNGELRETSYQARIAADETRRALLRLLPGISFDASLRHDTDKYLVNNRWQEAGVRVSFNLFNLLSGPSQMRAAELAEQVAQHQRMAMQMTVLTQVHLAWHGYDDALRQYKRADALATVDGELARIAAGQEASQTNSRLERISASVSSILSATRRYQAMARVHESASRLQALMGLEPQVGSLDDTDLPTLQRQIEQSLQRWSRWQVAAEAAPVSATASATATATAPVALAALGHGMVGAE